MLANRRAITLQAGLVCLVDTTGVSSVRMRMLANCLAVTLQLHTNKYIK